MVISAHLRQTTEHNPATAVQGNAAGEACLIELLDRCLPLPGIGQWVR